MMRQVRHSILDWQAGSCPIGSLQLSMLGIESSQTVLLMHTDATAHGPRYKELEEYILKRKDELKGSNLNPKSAAAQPVQAGKGF